MNKFELHLAANSANMVALELLKENCDLSVAQLKSAIQKGALWLESGKSIKRFRRVKKTLKQDDVLHFYYDQSVLSQQVEDAILLQDHQDFSIWYKPFGMLSQGSKWSEHTTITRFVSEHFEHQRSVFLVHRLDKAAQGIIVVSHTKSATKALAQMFEHHHLTKLYWVVSHHNNLLSEPLTIQTPIDNKSAQSEVKLLQYDTKENKSLVEVCIKTGRKHQIRKHMASIGMPVVGDRLHGIADETTKENLQLCAVHLSFINPLNQESVIVDLPSQLRPKLN